MASETYEHGVINHAVEYVNSNVHTNTSRGSCSVKCTYGYACCTDATISSGAKCGCKN